MLFKIIQKNRPHLSISSIRTYVSIIRNLAKQLKVNIEKPEDIVEYTDDIVELYKDLAPGLRKTRLSALIVFLDNEKNKVPGAEQTINLFREKMMKDGEEYKQEMKQQKLSDKQRNGWMDWNDIIANYKTIEKEVLPYFKSSTDLNKQQFKRAQLYVLLSCLLLIPPRRSTDYVAFKLRNEDVHKDNYMETKGRKSYFVFNTYKTAKRYGQEKVEIPTALKTIINRWKLINRNDYLLVNTKMNKNINPTQLNSMLVDYFNRPLSTSLMRHIFLTEKYRDVPAIQEMEQTAKEMGHSLTQAMEYVKKDV
jgi:integrase